jgi:DNA replication protein DnaC
MTEPCNICDGSGLRILTREDGSRYAVRCDCQTAVMADRRLERTGIPKRYEHCSFDSFEEAYDGADPSLKVARLKALRFVEGYPVETEGRGLLLTGSIGVGKTHLAVSILRDLVLEKGAHGLFCDYRDLLKQVQNSWNRQVATTELEVLRPVFEAEVLVLDELGASRPTDWVWDTVAHILNMRYNDKRTTIITTNYANVPPAAVGSSNDDVAYITARHASREETLGDRIGERMRSRLQEMCVLIEMRGDDLRQKVKRASLM